MSDSAETISLKIKTTTAVHEVDVSSDASVSQVKDAILAKVTGTKDQLCLIFSGKILKDNEKITDHKISDGMVVHLVIRQTGTPQAAERPATSAPSQPTPAPTSQAAPSNPPMNPFAAMSAGGGMGNPEGMAQQMMRNPEMMRQMMNSPMMQSMLSNPEVLRGMFANNPQIQALIESNPELGHILNDPEMIRQMGEMMRNPTMFNEMMRNHDLAIRNLQGIPGGEAALQRLYQDVQEPLLNSATGGGNPFASLRQNNEDQSSRSQRAGVENSEALPNPWGGGPAPSSPSGNQQRQAGGGGSAPAAGGMFSGMGGGQNDFMAQAMQMMRDNPQMLSQGLANNPLLAGGNGGPNVSNASRLLSDPSLMAAFTNPRVMEAFTQIMQANQTIVTEAPELARALGIPGMGMGARGGMNPFANAAPTTPSTTGAPTQTPTASGGADTAAAGANPLASMMNNPEMMSMMANMFGGMGLGGAPGEQAQPQGNPEEIYAQQLEQLSAMGFTNRAQNIAALRAVFGDLNAAVERLLNSPQ